MFLSKFKMQLRAKLALSFLFAVMLIAGFSQTANASCERTVYNKSDSTWVISLNKKNDKLPGFHDLKAMAAKSQKVIESSNKGWTIIVYPYESRRIHYDDTYYAGRKDGPVTIKMQIKSFVDPVGVQPFKKDFLVDAWTGTGNEFLSAFSEVKRCGVIQHIGNTGSRITVNQPAEGDIIFEPTEHHPSAHCVNFFTEVNGGGKRLNLCDSLQNWKDNTNLGSLGIGIHSHHHDVRSFQCGSKVGRVQFMDGNKTPMPRHNEYCKDGNMVNPDPWVTGYATGVKVFGK